MKTLIYKITSLAVLVLSLSSCLKDRPNNLDPSGSHNVVQFQNIVTSPAVTTSVYPLYITSFDIKPTGELKVAIGYAGPESVAPQDITVNLALGDQAMLDAYNDEQHTEYTFFPANLYEGIPSSVVIPKGQQKVEFNIIVKPDQFNLNASYALPLQITGVSSSVVSGNFGKVIVAVAAKNPYDGVYSYKFRMSATDRPTFKADGSLITWPGNIFLMTTGATTVALFDDWGFGTFIQPIQTSTGGNSGLGSAAPVFTIDATTNKITSVVNYYPNAANGRKFVIDPTGVNTYDPATKKVTATYFLTQPGFGPLKFISEFTYVRSR